jgi:crotonobetainyl-CoA:carnitine CoA-transferase CaiB-like acyl-CoA transferase
MGPRSFVEAEATASEQVFRCFATRDGHVVGMAAQDSQFQALCRALEREDLLEDERFAQVSERFLHLPEFHEVLAGELAQRSTADFIECAQACGAPFAEVLDLDGFFADPQVRHNETLQVREVEGAGGVRYLRPPLRFARSPSGIQRPPPRLGEHSDEVLAEIGYTPARLTALREDGHLR